VRKPSQPRQEMDATADVTDADGHVRLSLGLYVLGALDDARCEAVEQHLVSCRDCRAQHEYIADMPRYLDSLKPQELAELLGGNSSDETGQC
jgi:anti-sigma factor RsiW